MKLASKYDIDFLLRQGWRIYHIGKGIPDSQSTNMRDFLKNRCDIEFNIEKETGLVFLKDINQEVEGKSIL